MGIFLKMLSASGAASAPWDISSAVFLQSFSVAAQDTSPEGLFFSSDGTKMYVVGNDGGQILQYNLSTAWDISTASYSQAFSDNNIEGLFFKPDGLKMYLVDNGAEKIIEYTLSTAWDISTAVFARDFGVTAQGTGPSDVFFRSDGAKMYVVDRGEDHISEYTLSTVWNISTAVFVQSYSVTPQNAQPRGVFFRPDGARMYVTDNENDVILQYTLSTVWDISTASFTKTFDISLQDTVLRGLFFTSDGTNMYVVGGFGDSVYQYNLGSQ